jgi:hypothetical protein
MNFLQIAQQAAVECGVADRVAVSTFSTVVGATGSFGRIVGWVNDAWTDIQMDQDDWFFMRSSVLLGGGVSFATIYGQASYPLGIGAGTVGVATDSFGKWDTETFRNYATASGPQGEIDMDSIDFDHWRDGYAWGAQRAVRTRPIVVAVGPDQSLCLGPFPNDQYTIEADYFVAPSEMVLNTDVPVGLPVRFHMLIVYRVMIKAGRFDSAAELFERGTEENAGMYAQLLRARAPTLSFGGALA